MALSKSVDVEPEGYLGVGALIIDVGTGALKLLAALHFECMELHELCEVKMEDMVEDKELKAMITTSSIFTAGVGGSALDEEQMTPGFQYVAAKLRAALDKLVNEATWLQHCTLTDGFLGCTAWLRDLRQTNKPQHEAACTFLDALCENFNAKLAELKLNLHMRWGEVAGANESQWEWRSVEYIMREKGFEPPVAVLAGGNGSVQLTGLDTFFSFWGPLSEGARLLKAAPTHAEGVQLWQDQLCQRFDIALRDATDGTQLASVLARGAQRALKEKLPSDHPQAAVRLVLISSFYYTAVAAGLVDKKARTYLYQPAVHVCAKLRAMRDDPQAKPKDVANATRLHAVLERIFSGSGDDEKGLYLDHVQLLFARDWTIGEGNDKPFRTTWTAGWYLDLLVEQFKDDTQPSSLRAAR